MEASMSPGFSPDPAERILVSPERKAVRFVAARYLFQSSADVVPDLGWENSIFWNVRQTSSTSLPSFPKNLSAETVAFVSLMRTALISSVTVFRSSFVVAAANHWGVVWLLAL